ncbi:MAG: aminotransferase class I/II-fold pyridoxal phosphate-dependent enzyme, partial [Planctomycetota bacterium]
PNNPTGMIATADDARAVARALPHALIVLDLAYAEFADEDLTPLVTELPNAVAVRTFSKAFGLAGLRVGYVVGRPEHLAWLATVGNPFPCSGPSMAIAEAALADSDHLARTIEQTLKDRDAIIATLTDLGVETLSSQGNFVLARHPQSATIHRELAARGIAIRRYPQPEILADRIRIGCPGSDAHLALLLDELREVVPAATTKA